MNFITSQFQNFTFVSYLTLIIVILCYLFSLGSNLKEDRANSPLWPLIISNVAFNYFLSSTLIYSQTYTKILFFLSAICIIWFYWIKVNENQENKDRGFIRKGQESVNKGYNDTKQSIKKKASQTAGGGFLGALVESAIDIGTSNIDNKLTSFLGSFGNSREYFHPSRGPINFLRNSLIFSMIVLMFYLT